MQPVECSFIGRDLIRALKDAATVEPRMQQLLDSVIAGAIPNMPTFERLLLVPTPKHFLQTRLPHDMEADMLFIMENVHRQYRYYWL